jgi:hypothetical protein
MPICLFGKDSIILRYENTRHSTLRRLPVPSSRPEHVRQAIIYLHVIAYPLIAGKSPVSSHHHNGRQRTRTTVQTFRDPSPPFTGASNIRWTTTIGPTGASRGPNAVADMQYVYPLSDSSIFHSHVLRIRLSTAPDASQLSQCCVFFWESTPTAAELRLLALSRMWRRREPGVGSEDIGRRAGLWASVQRMRCVSVLRCVCVGPVGAAGV